MEIKRNDLKTKLHSFLARHSGLIYGAPGAGKSYIIEKILDERLESRRLTIVLPVDQFVEGDDGEIKSLLETKLDPVEFLKQLGTPSAEECIAPLLIFDGLDAARNPVTENNFLKLLSKCKRELSDWGVFASIREFDLLKNDQVKNLFGIKELSLSDQVFFIPELSVEEIKEGFVSTGLLADEIITVIDKKLLKVLQNPFSFWLFTKILERKELSKIGSIRAEVELLDKYSSTIIGVKKELITTLSLVTSEMADSGVLTISANKLVGNSVLDDLLRAGILVYSSVGKDRVCFKHNIFFDYFVSVYCFGDTNKDFFSYLEADFKRPVFLQQSIKYFFFRLWVTFRERYWEAVDFCFASKNISTQLLAKTVPFLPPIFNIDSTNELLPVLEKKPLKDNYLKFLTYGLMQFPEVRPDIRIELLAKIVEESSDQAYWNSVVSLSGRLDNNLPESDIEKISKVLVKSYNDLSNSLSNGNLRFLRDYWVLPGLVKSLPYSKSEKSKVIEGILSGIGEKGYSVKEIYNLSSNIEKIIDHIPEVAVQIYHRVFSFEEKRTDAVQMGTPIMPLQSNLRQDYNMAYYQLHSSFDYFCKANIKFSLQAGLGAAQGEILRKHSVNKSDKYTFQYAGKKFEFIEDYSYIWGNGSKLDDYGEMIVDQIFTTFIDQLPNLEISANEILEVVLQEERPVYFLSKLIELGAKYPDRLPEFIASVLTNSTFLKSTYDRFHVCMALENVFPVMSEELKGKIEDAIWSMKDECEEEKLKYVDADIDSYFNAIPDGALSQERSIKRKQEMIKENVRISRQNYVEVSWGKVDEKEFLIERGIDPKEKKTQDVLDFILMFSEFAESDNLSEENIKKLKKEISRSVEMCNELYPSELCFKLLEDLLSKIDNCFFKFKDLWEEEDLNNFEKLLIIASDCPKPEYDEEYHSSFNNPSWSTTAKTEAAQFVCKLGVLIKSKENIYKVIEKLVQDRVPAIRYLLIAELFRVHFYNKDLFWKITNDIIEKEQFRSIKLVGLHNLSRIYQNDLEKSELALSKGFDISEDDEMTKFLIRTIVDLTLLNIGQFSEKKLLQIVNKPNENLNGTARLVNSLLSYIYTSKKKENEDKMRKTSQKILGNYINNCSSILLASETYSEELKPIYTVISESILRSYFASEFEVLNKLTDEVRVNQIDSIQIIIKHINNYLEKNGTLDPHTIYELNKLAFNILDENPKFSIDLVYNALMANKEGGYRSDSMAAKELVKFVERALAKHKAMLRSDDDSMKKIVNILECFADFGWPEALGLVWKLDKIYK